MVLWLLCNLLMLAAGLAIFISLLDWQLSPGLFALVVCLSGFFLPVLTSTWLGQLSIFSFFILALTTYLFLHQRWTWLGIVVGLSFIKPQVMILLAGLLLLWSLWRRRLQTLLGFGGVMTVLVLISLPFISFPGQIIGGGIGSHLTSYIKSTSTLWGLFLTLGISWVVPAVISIVLIYMAWLDLAAFLAWKGNYFQPDPLPFLSYYAGQPDIGTLQLDAQPRATPSPVRLQLCSGSTNDIKGAICMADSSICDHASAYAGPLHCA